MQQGQVLDELRTKAVREHHDDGEDHRGRPHHGGADKNRLGGRFERVAGPVVRFQIVLGALEVDVEAILLLELLLDVRDLLDHAQLVDRLRVVRHRAVRVHGDGDRPHAQKAEGHEAEREDGRGIKGVERHERTKTVGAHDPGDSHQDDEDDAHPVRTVVARHKSGQDVQRRAALPRGDDHLPHVPGFRGGEHLYQLWDNCPREGAAGNDERELPPERRVPTQVRNEKPGKEEGKRDGDGGGQPHQRRERLFIVEIVRIAVAGFGNGFVHKIGQRAGHDHHDAHHEDPDQELDLDGRVLDG